MSDSILGEIKELEQRKKDIDNEIRQKLESLKNTGDFCKKLETEFNEYGIKSDLNFDKVNHNENTLRK